MFAVIGDVWKMFVGGRVLQRRSTEGHKGEKSQRGGAQEEIEGLKREFEAYLESETTFKMEEFHERDS